ncbi:MAG: PBECR4 domain-containing protein [Butyrivibrio sp.]|nr:PBECR4 domain-containing protein [Butyrivibrio sp.]
MENRNLLLICTNASMNKTTAVKMQFEAKNFMHLTGVKFQEGKRLPPDTFYMLCLTKRLSLNDFELAEDGTTEQKLSVLLPIVSSAGLSANMIGDYNARRPALFTEKLAGGVKACVGFVYDKSRKCYVPNTVLKMDIRDNIANRLRIIATYRKSRIDEKYSEIVYKAKKVNWTKIMFPKEYEYLKKLEDAPLPDELQALDEGRRDRKKRDNSS